MTIPPKDWWDQADKDAFLLVQEQFFKQPDLIQIDVDFEGAGYRSEDQLPLTLDGPLVFGCRAGGSYEIQNLLHEMSHFLEIDLPRIGKPGWGLKYREVYLMGRIYQEPLTWKSSEREARVIGYQIVLGRLLGLQPDVTCIVSSLKHMPDYYVVPGSDERARLQHLAGLAVATSLTLTPDFIRQEWQRRLDLLPTADRTPHHGRVLEY